MSGIAVHRIDILLGGGSSPEIIKKYHLRDQEKLNLISPKEKKKGRCTHPVGPLKLQIERSSSVASNARGEGINDNQCSKKSSSVVRVENTHKSQNKYEDCPTIVLQKFI